LISYCGLSNLYDIINYWLLDLNIVVHDWLLDMNVIIDYGLFNFNDWLKLWYDNIRFQLR